VKGVFTYVDVPGKNVWGDIVEDEELFASSKIVHYGQPIAIVVAETEIAAKKAAKLVQVVYDEDAEIPPIFTIEQAVEKNSFFDIKHTVTDGEPNQASFVAENTVSASVFMGGQEQFYFEPHVTLAIPEEGEMLIYSSTQNAHKTQHIVAKALGIPANKVVCKVPRIGGGFGGKETRNIPFSMAAAVAAQIFVL